MSCLSEIAYLNVSRTEFTKRGVRVIGQYYCLYEGGKYKLSDINERIVPYSQITAFETQLGEFETKSIQEVVSQRTAELMFATLQMEGLSNFDIDPNDWEVLIEVAE